MTEIIHYMSSNDLIKSIYGSPHRKDNLLLVSGVTPDDFEEICNERDNQKRRFQCFLFEPQRNLLYITLPIVPQEIMHSLLHHKITQKLTFSKGPNDWEDSGSVLYPGCTGVRAVIGAGEGSAGSKPFRLRGLANDWPTLMIEVGYSSSLVLLRQKMCWWFSASNFDVKVVLLVCFDTIQQRGAEVNFMTVEKWTAPEMKGKSQCHDLTPMPPVMQSVNQITYSGPAITAENRQQIVPDMFRVSGSSLPLECKLLLLREPHIGSDETDIIIHTDWLRNYAMRVWQSVASYRSTSRW